MAVKVGFSKGLSLPYIPIEVKYPERTGSFAMTVRGFGRAYPSDVEGIHGLVPELVPDISPEMLFILGCLRIKIGIGNQQPYMHLAQRNEDFNSNSTSGFLLFYGNNPKLPRLSRDERRVLISAGLILMDPYFRVLGDETSYQSVIDSIQILAEQVVQSFGLKRVDELPVSS